jgi:hypothetical protein
MTFTQLVSLSQMENTVRRMTARYTEQQMSTSQIDYYINLAVQLFMPLEFKNLKLTKPYVFNTVPNVDTYPFIYEAGLVDDPTLPPGNRAAPGNIQIMPPVYCQGYQLRYYQDKSTFYNRWPNLSVNQIINNGSGLVASTYSGIIPSTPFYRSQLDIFGFDTIPAVTISAYDNTGFSYVVTDVPVQGSNTGNLTDSGGNVVGTVNYVTGAYSFIPLGIIPTTAKIYAAVVPYQPSRPTDVLFYNQQIVFRPCPMQVFQVEFQISQQPTQLIANNAAPELDEWYLYICSRASRLIYNDFPDPEGEASLKPILEEQIQIAQRRSLRQMSTQRAQTIFSTPGWSRNAAGLYLGTEYSGS